MDIETIEWLLLNTNVYTGDKQVPFLEWLEIYEKPEQKTDKTPKPRASGSDNK